MGESDTLILAIDILGWAGALLYLLAYFLFSAGKLPGETYTYQLLNLFGGLFLIVNAFYYRAYPSVGVNVVWSIITVYAMVRKAQGLARQRASI